VPLERLQMGQYKPLIETLNMRKLSTTELIQHYLVEKCKEQVHAFYPGHWKSHRYCFLMFIIELLRTELGSNSICNRSS